MGWMDVGLGWLGVGDSRIWGDSRKETEADSIFYAVWDFGRGYEIWVIQEKKQVREVLRVDSVNVRCPMFGDVSEDIPRDNKILMIQPIPDWRTTKWQQNTIKESSLPAPIPPFSWIQLSNHG